MNVPQRYRLEQERPSVNWFEWMADHEVGALRLTLVLAVLNIVVLHLVK